MAKSPIEIVEKLLEVHDDADQSALFWTVQRSQDLVKVVDRNNRPVLTIHDLQHADDILRRLGL